MNTFLFFGLTIFAFQTASCAKILGVFPIPSISHQVVYRALTTELAKRGHQLTVITPDPIWDHGLPEENYKQIDVHDLSYSLWSELFNFVEIRNELSSPVDMYPEGKKALMKIYDAQLESPEVKEFIRNSTEQFDLLLIESFSPVHFGFAWRFKAPYIGFMSMTGTLSNFESLGNPTHPFLYADFFRQKAVLGNLFDKIEALHHYLYIRYVDICYTYEELTFARKHFGEDCPDPQELQSNMDMFFMNSNPIVSGVRPLVPAIITLGGMHLKQKQKLPRDLQEFLDNSPEGVVYMSLGSNVRSKDLPRKTLNMIVEVFSELPHKVLWKFEDDLPNLPDNIRTSRWLPQQDLLGHPQIKVFITQGGQQSMEEAIRDKVPLIGIPFMGDQDLNVQNIVRLGIGAGLEIRTLTKKQFNETILEVVSDCRYKKAMERLSSVMFDQPMSSVERAVWWTEYVLRHGGAAHLRAPAAGVSNFHYFMLDVFASLLIGATLILLVLVWVGRKIHSYLFYEYLKLKTN